MKHPLKNKIKSLGKYGLVIEQVVELSLWKYPFLDISGVPTRFWEGGNGRERAVRISLRKNQW